MSYWRMVFIRRYLTHVELWDIMSGDWEDSGLEISLVKFLDGDIYDVHHQYFHTDDEAQDYIDSVCTTHVYLHNRGRFGTLEVICLDPMDNEV